MTDTKAAQKPAAWKCSKCGNTSYCEGATVDDNWCGSCGACNCMTPLYDAPTLDSHGRYWIENRGRIIDAVTAAGFRLMSNADGFWLQPLSARVVPPVIIAANLDSTR